MQKPTIRVVQDQETTISDAHGWEAEQLLRKYGFEKEQQTPIYNPTFDELCNQLQVQQPKRNDYKPVTFQSDNYDSHATWASDKDTGYEFKVTIVSDMKIPKY